LSRGYKENLVNRVNPVKKVPPQAAKFRERLSAFAADIVSQKHLDQPGNTLVIVSGSNDTSREALLNRDLIIQHFPFTIAR